MSVYAKEHGLNFFETRKSTKKNDNNTIKNFVSPLLMP